jgi:protein-disulfide isomerase
MSSPSSRESAAITAAAVRAAQERAEQRRRWTMIGTVLAVVAVIVAGAVWFSRGDTTGEGPTAVAGAPRGATGYGVVLGQEDAPTSVVIYEDFQCPICADFEQATAEQVAAGIEAGKVEVEYRVVSFLDQASENEYSSRAANAAAVVLDTAGPEAFKRFHDILFQNQPAEGTAGPENSQLIQWAVEAGADEAEVSAGIENGEFDQWVVDATDAMSKDGVTGTPTVVIDGQKLAPEEALQELLAAVK